MSEYAPPLPDRWALAIRQFRDGRVAPRDLEEMRELAKAGICPFCRKGPFQSPVGHSARAHGIERFEFRDRLGFLLSERFTDGALHAKLVANGRKNYESGALARGRFAESRAPRVFSSAGMQVQLAKLAKARQAQGADADLRNPLPPEVQQQLTEASIAATRRRMEPLSRLAVATYVAIVAEHGKAYGAVKATSDRLGWEESTTAQRLRAAWDAGLGIGERPARASSEERECPVCGEVWTANRATNWANLTCGLRCGRELTARAQRKAAREATCMICGRRFIYKRQGSKPRTLCDRVECRSELSRRTQAGRVWTAESRQKLSASKRRRAGVA